MKHNQPKIFITQALLVSDHWIVKRLIKAQVFLSPETKRLKTEGRGWEAIELCYFIHLPNMMIIFYQKKCLNNGRMPWRFTWCDCLMIKKSGNDESFNKLCIALRLREI